VYLLTSLLSSNRVVTTQQLAVSFAKVSPYYERLALYLVVLSNGWHIHPKSTLKSSYQAFQAPI
jgi:hypothetical protein